MKPLAVDLFCGAGGASMGLYRAGFDVIGVDVKPQPRYPFQFVRGDALEQAVLLRFADFIWASPPCQAASKGPGKWRNNGTRTYPQHIPATRKLLQETDRPFVIENVVGAPIRKDIILSGKMFGLAVERRRLFETEGFFTLQPPMQRHRAMAVYTGEIVGCYRGTSYHKKKNIRAPRGTTITMSVAMQIDWMKRDWELAEAIPPAYAEFIGRAALAWMSSERAAA